MNAQQRRDRYNRAFEALADALKHNTIVTVQEVRLSRKASRIFVYICEARSIPVPNVSATACCIRSNPVDITEAVAIVCGYRVSKWGGITGTGRDVYGVFAHLARTIWPTAPGQELRTTESGVNHRLVHGLIYKEMPTWFHG